MRKQHKSDVFFHRIVTLAFVLSVLVIALGAYTRLTEAGLGCPDWPGCYGFIAVPQTAAEQQAAQLAFPDVPLEPHKAWNEMLHRYLAGSLGMIILALNVLAWRRATRPKVLPLALLVMVTIQALLGMWTVTELLMPAIVMAHLLGGFTIVTLLWLLRLNLQSAPSLFKSGSQDATVYSSRTLTRLRIVVTAAVITVVIQIALGGWTAANYAAVVCTQLPICEADWQQIFDASAFELIQPPHDSYQYGVLNYQQRVSIHVVHRIGAMVTASVVLLAAWLLWRQRSLRRYSLLITAALTIQILLGVTNVLASLPLAVAVAHNVVGMMLLLSLVTTGYSLYCHQPRAEKFAMEGKTHG